METSKLFKVLGILFLFPTIFTYGGQAPQQDLELEKVIVVSRHNVRAPLEQYLDTMDKMTGDRYHWMRWSVPGSHLTHRGDSLEKLFGEYFRLWFLEEHFELDSDDVYLGASSKQRTVATAKAFASTLLPQMHLSVDYKKKNSTYGYLDPDYLPLLNNHSVPNFDTLAFKTEAYRELGPLTHPSYELLERLLRFSHSNYAKERSINHFDSTVGVRLNFYDFMGNRLEPTMTGGLRAANMASDAFILQYYEMENDKDAAFGHTLTFNDWREVASVKDYYGHILFSKAPIISVNVSHCMLKRVYSELMPDGHKFAFFCTHDSMIESLLAALRVKPYHLTNTIESSTPIGVKILFEVWTDNKNHEKYVRVRLLYQSADQIRKIEKLDIDNPPMIHEISFTGITKASNGMYRYDDFMLHMQKSLQAYHATAKGIHPWQKRLRW